MLGAIAGDIIGSRFEWNNIKTTEFTLFTPESTFTDDSVLTVAVAQWVLDGGPLEVYISLLKEYTRRYPGRGYGGFFMTWVHSDQTGPYNSWGNGSAMRVSPVGFACNHLDEVLEKAKETAMVTHDHPEGIKGAQATAAAIFLARTGKDKEAIKEYVSTTFGYNLDEPIDQVRPTYRFDVSCQGTVPPAIRAFLESTSVEDAIRLAVSLGGDSDTVACITGGIAEAFFGGLPEALKQETLKRLDPGLKKVVNEFYRTYEPFS
ncbi:ADP-ribosylglycohydrolase family protein [Candidatus Bathyarchaeota archaeon]|nr:ADP-ribosylglycohydrolase family protein [Candidatus Bathyarchaeota archaeon]